MIRDDGQWNSRVGGGKCGTAFICLARNTEGFGYGQSVLQCDVPPRPEYHQHHSPPPWGTSYHLCRRCEELWREVWR